MGNNDVKGVGNGQANSNVNNNGNGKVRHKGNRNKTKIVIFGNDSNINIGQPTQPTQQLPPAAGPMFNANPPVQQETMEGWGIEHSGTTKKEDTPVLEEPVEEKENNVKPNRDKEDHKKPENGVGLNPDKVPPKGGIGFPTPPVVVPTPTAPRIVDNDGLDNKDGIIQRGNGNIYVAPGATVIIGDGATGVNPIDGDTHETKPVPKETDEITGKEDSKPKSLTPKEIKAARDNGEKAADALLGRTTNTEQKTVQDIVNKEINADNVLEFLRGYEKELKEHNLWAGPLSRGDHFFEQMRTENNFPEQQELMRKSASDLQVYLENKYGTDSSVAKEVAVILLEETLGEEQAKALDEIYRKELGGKNKKSGFGFPNPMMGAGQAIVSAVENLNE